MLDGTLAAPDVGDDRLRVRGIHRGVASRIAIAGLLAGVGFATFAAPPNREDPFSPPDLERYVRWGALRVRPGFEMPNLGVDDNVFFASGDEPKQSDLRLTLGVRLEGLLLLGRRSFYEFNERFDYTAYQTYDLANFHRQRFDSRFTYPLEKIGFYVDLDQLNSQARLTSELDSRTQQRLRRLGGGVLLRLGWRTTAQIGHVHNDWKFTNPEDPEVGPLLDRIERGPKVDFEYRLTSLTRLFLETEYKNITFDDPAVRRDSREWTVLPGVRFGERGRLSGSFAIGRTEIDNEDPEKLDLSEPVGEAALAYKMGYGSSLNLRALREVGFAVYSGNNYYLNRDANLVLTHFFNRFFGLVGGGGKGRLTFPGADDDRVDDITRYEFGFKLRVSRDPMGRRVEYGLKWRWFMRDSNIEGLDQTRKTVGFEASVGF